MLWLGAALYRQNNQSQRGTNGICDQNPNDILTWPVNLLKLSFSGSPDNPRHGMVQRKPPRQLSSSLNDGHDLLRVRRHQHHSIHGCNHDSELFGHFETYEYCALKGRIRQT